MVGLTVKPTRMEMNKLKVRLKTAIRGHKLLKDKRDELMRRFIELVKENNRLRQEVETSLTDHLRDFVLAKSLENDKVVEQIFAVPTKKVEVYLTTENIMSVDVPRLHSKVTNPYGDDEGDVVYSYLASNSQMDAAISQLESSLPKLLRLAEVEKSCQLMADEIEKTRRRVNSLEHSTIPQLEETIYYIQMKLEETERANLVRMMKVKDMGRD